MGSLPTSNLTNSVLSLFMLTSAVNPSMSVASSRSCGSGVSLIRVLVATAALARRKSYCLRRIDQNPRMSGVMSHFVAELRFTEYTTEVHPQPRLLYPERASIKSTPVTLLASAPASGFFVASRIQPDMGPSPRCDQMAGPLARRFSQQPAKVKSAAEKAALLRAGNSRDRATFSETKHERSRHQARTTFRPERDDFRNLIAPPCVACSYQTSLHAKALRHVVYTWYAQEASSHGTHQSLSRTSEAARW